MISSSSTALKPLIHNCQLDIPTWISKGISTFCVQNPTLDFTQSPKPAPPTFPLPTPFQQFQSSRDQAKDSALISMPPSHPHQQILLVLFSKRTLNFLNTSASVTTLVQITNSPWMISCNSVLISLCASLLAPEVYFTHSSQNYLFKNQVNFCLTPSHGFLFQGDLHHGLLFSTGSGSLLPLASSLATFSFIHSY